MIAKCTRPVFMVHICSQCGFPIISVVHIHTESQKTYSYLESKATQIVQETVENAIREEICRIESCGKTKDVLVGTKDESSMIRPGYFCESSFSGHQTRCPFCFNVEPWKVPSSYISISQLKDENFPTVFTEAAHAEQWALGYVKNMLDTIKRKAMDVETVARAEMDSVEALFRIEKLLRAVESFPEYDELKQMDKQLLDLKQQKTQLGAFDFKCRKKISDHITVTEQAVEAVRRIVEDKKAKMQIEIFAIKKELTLSQAIAFGCKNDIVTSKLENAVVFYFIPNDIPSVVINRYNLLLDYRPGNASDGEGCVD